MDALCEIGGGNGGAVRHTAHVRFRYGPFICMCTMRFYIMQSRSPCRRRYIKYIIIDEREKCLGLRKCWKCIFKRDFSTAARALQNANKTQKFLRFFELMQRAAEPPRVFHVYTEKKCNSRIIMSHARRPLNSCWMLCKEKINIYAPPKRSVLHGGGT